MKSQTLLLSALVIGLCVQSHGGQIGNKSIVDFANVKDSDVILKAIEENETILPETVGIAARFNLKPVGVEESVSVKEKGICLSLISMDLLNLVSMRMKMMKTNIIIVSLTNKDGSSANPERFFLKCIQKV